MKHPQGTSKSNNWNQRTKRILKIEEDDTFHSEEQLYEWPLNSHQNHQRPGNNGNISLKGKMSTHKSIYKENNFHKWKWSEDIFVWIKTEKIKYK